MHSSRYTRRMQAPLPNAAAFSCFTTDVKSMPLLTSIVIIYVLSLRVILEHPSAKGLYREVFETATWLTINALTSKTSRYNWIPAIASIQSLEVTVFIPKNERSFLLLSLSWAIVEGFLWTRQIDVKRFTSSRKIEIKRVKKMNKHIRKLTL